MIIRVSIPLESSQVAGRRKFIGQLKRILKKNPELEFVLGSADINLATDPTEWDPNAKKNLYRLDGLWLDPVFNKDPQERNMVIMNMLERADCVVYQAKFAKRAQEKMYPDYKVKSHKTIYNGACPKRFTEKYIHDKPYFITYSKWIGDDGIRGHKRLEPTIASFIWANLSNVDLFVCGEVDKQIKHSNVKYLGWKQGKELDMLIAGAVGSVHIPFVDWCPNAVVESLVAGVPVIYTPNSGVKEFVGDNGYLVEDVPFEFKIQDIYHPPLLNLDKVAEMYKKCLEEKKKAYAPNLFIKTIAKQYFKTIKEVYERRR